MATNIEDLVLCTKEPIVLVNMISDWEQLKWTQDEWSAMLGDRHFPFRVGHSRCSSTPQWESTCLKEQLTMKKFFQLTESDPEISASYGNRWMYFDYKHMEEWFETQSSLLKSVSWSAIGFPDKTGRDSTIWIGSRGAHTACHMDTYGCNLVAQLYGTKRWIMFPPSAKPFLEPSRVPYEESSIYSGINFACGCSNLKNIKEEARVVVLKPGDILVVPKHWWHYVENLSTAISINTWIPLPSDDESRLEESLVRCFVSSFVHRHPHLEKQVLLNPNEDDLTESRIEVELINWCVERHEEQSRVKTVEVEQKELEDRLASVLQTYSSVVRTVPKMVITELGKLLVEKCSSYKLTATEYKQSGGVSGDTEKQSGDKDGSPLVASLTAQARHIINAFCDPDVISLVKAKLLQQVCQGRLNGLKE